MVGIFGRLKSWANNEINKRGGMKNVLKSAVSSPFGSAILGRLQPVAMKLFDYYDIIEKDLPALASHAITGDITDSKVMNENLTPKRKLRIK